MELVARRADVVLKVAEAAAAAGAVVVSVGPSAPRGPEGTVPDLVLVDAGDPGCVGPGEDASAGDSPTPAVGSQRPVLAVCLAGESAAARGRALAVGASHLVELPDGAPWLVERMGPSRGRTVVGVVGAVGGGGASTVAIALAVGGAAGMLVDADPGSAGLDLALGIGDDQGVRWPGIPPGRAPLDPGSLRSALPRVSGTFVLTGGGLSAAGIAERLPGLLAAARGMGPRTVVDLGRGGLVAAARPDALLVVLPTTLSGVLGARRLVEELPAGIRVAAVVRPDGWLPVDEVVARVGCPVLGEVPRWRRATELAECGELLAGRTGRSLRSFGARLWEVLP